MAERQRAIEPPPETQKLLIKIVRLLNTLEIELVDYIEYADCVFFSYARAVDGDIGIKSIDNATDGERTKPDWKTLAENYYEYCVRESIAGNLE